MGSAGTKQTRENVWLSRPETGNLITILAGLAFLVVCMILPLVGKAGVQTVHYRENLVAFSIALFAASALSILALRSKMIRRKLDGSPSPTFTLLLAALCGLLWLALLGGLLKI